MQNRSQKTVFYLILVFAGLAVSCQKQNVSVIIKQKTPENTLVVNREIPKDWQKIETNSFSFSIPSSLKNKNVRGIDTAVWEYEDEKVNLSIEQGNMSGNLEDAAEFSEQRYESYSERTIINGEKVLLLFLDINKPKLENWAVNADGSTRIEEVKKNREITAYFLNQAASFSIQSEKKDEETAKLILQSIKFKK